jgi:RNA polymerase sigma-70 factor, ECF subfamily
MIVGEANAPEADRTSDEELLLRFIGGESGGFEQLFLRYRQPVYGFFRRRLEDAAVAEELAQETFVAVLKSAERYKPSSLVRTWIYAIALNLLRAHRRKAAFRATFLGFLSPDREPAASPALENTLQIRQAVAKLDAADREILRLREFEQLSYAEIAALLSLPLNTVRSRLFRARQAMHALLAAPADRPDAAPSEVRA